MRPWFSQVARWATSGALAVDFVKAVSVDEVRSRLGSGRRFSALLVDAGLVGIDRDLIETAREVGCAPIVVCDRQRQRDWLDLGAAATLPADFGRTEIEQLLAEVATPIGRPDDVPGEAVDQIRPAGFRARTVAVTGAGGTGASVLAMALAQGYGSSVSTADNVVLADLALHADQALLHDARDVIPGVLELIEAHRAGSPAVEDVRALTFDITAHRYRLLLGLRRHRDWTAVRPRALQAALDGLRRSFRLVIADIDGDFEGEAETGSPDIGDRNLLARSVAGIADVVVVVGAPGVGGVHSLLRVVRDLLELGVGADRIVPVVNRSPRRAQRQGRGRTHLRPAPRREQPGFGGPRPAVRARAAQRRRSAARRRRSTRPARRAPDRRGRAPPRRGHRAREPRQRCGRRRSRRTRLARLVDTGAGGGPLMASDADANPLVAIERTVVERAKGIDLDLDGDGARAQLRLLLDEEVRRWSDDYRRGLRSFDLADPKLLVERGYRNLVGYGPLEALLDDDDVWEVMINAPDAIFVKRHRGQSGYHDEVFHDDEHVLRTLTKILDDAAGAHRKLDPTEGLQDAQLDDGARLHIVHSDVSSGGHVMVNIRKFTGVAFRELGELVERSMLTAQAAGFLRACAAATQTVVFAGAPGSGKTTLLSCTAAELDPSLRVVVAEEVFEADIPLPNVASMQTRAARAERPAVDLRRLVAGFLRMAPDVAIVGEVRDREALPLLLTLSSGVKGFTTIHAGSARAALSRLRFICQLSDTASDIPMSALNNLVSESIDVVVHCAREADGPRVTEIIAVEELAAGLDSAQFTTTPLFTRAGPDAPLEWTGQFPARLDDNLARAGVRLRELLGGPDMGSRPATSPVEAVR